MRRIGPPVQRERGTERRAPAPRWRGRLLRAAALAAAGGLVVGAVELVARTDIEGTVHDAAVAGLDASGRSLGLTVQEVLAEGRERTPQPALAKVLKPYVGQSSLTVDLAEVQEKVQALPWVRTAVVTRLLPDTILVRIEEHEAVALWHDGKRTMLVGVDGSLLAISDLRAFASLKLLRGEGAPEAARELLELLSTAPDLAKRVTAANRIAKRRWNLFVDGRIEVRLPERDAAQAWSRFVAFERRDQLMTRSIESVDFRNPAWTAVRLKGERKDLILGRGV